MRQGQIQKLIEQALFPSCLWFSLLARFARLGIPIEERNNIERSTAQAFINSLPPTHAFQLLRSWSHSWLKTCRLHDVNRLPCLFGCLAKDEEAHYFNCPIVWLHVVQISGFHPGESCFQRLALNCRIPDVINLCLVSHAFHVIRANSLGAIRGNVISQRFGENHKLWLRAATAAFARYGGLEVRPISLV